MSKRLNMCSTQLSILDRYLNIAEHIFHMNPTVDRIVATMTPSEYDETDSQYYDGRVIFEIKDSEDDDVETFTLTDEFRKIMGGRTPNVTLCRDANKTLMDLFFQREIVGAEDNHIIVTRRGNVIVSMTCHYPSHRESDEYETSVYTKGGKR